MYKVFVNHKPIILTDSFSEMQNYEVVSYETISFADLLSLIRKPSVQGVVLKTNKIRKAWKHFKSNFTVKRAAGGKVYHTNGKVLWIYRFDKWDLPKGHIEKGEKKKTAAIREVTEECGVTDLTVVKKLDKTYHVFEFNGKLRLKITHWYQMTTAFDGKLVPQIEEGITAVCFKGRVACEEALENTYPNIKLLF